MSPYIQLGDDNNTKNNNYEKSKNKKSKQQKLTKTVNSTKKRTPKNLIKIKKEIEEIPMEIEEENVKATLLKGYEHLLCLNNLGRRYEFG